MTSAATDKQALDKLCIDTIRTLSMDAVQKANSGHPGTPMALAPVAYTLYTRADDGVRLWLDGQLLINDWQRHPATERSATIQLQAGRKYALKLEYFCFLSGIDWMPAPQLSGEKVFEPAGAPIETDDEAGAGDATAISGA